MATELNQEFLDDLLADYSDAKPHASTALQRFQFLTKAKRPAAKPKFKNIEAVVLTRGINGDPPWMTVVVSKRDGRVVNGSPSVDGCAITNAQAVIAAVLNVVKSAGPLARELVVYVRDGQALKLLLGEARPRTPEVRSLIEKLDQAKDSCQGSIEFRYGGLVDLLGDDAENYDAWDH